MPLKVGGFDFTDIAPGGTAAAAAHFPFEISFTSSDTEGDYIKVRPGTVSGLLPDNIFDKIFVSEGTFYIKLRCQTDGKTPTKITLFIDNNSDLENQLS